MAIQCFFDLEYANNAGTSLRLDIFRPDDDRVYPVLLNVHGGGWCAGGRGGAPSFSNHVSHGYVVVDMEYRLAPAYPYPAACEDVHAAAQWLLAHAGEYNGDATRFAAIGYSAGGHLVAMLATEPNTPVKCTVCWGSPTDMRREPVTYPHRGYAWAFMSACPNEHPELYAEASPVTHLSAQTPPILHIHGTADAVVPVHHAHLLAEAAARVGAPVELLIQQDGGHCVAGNEEDGKAADARIWAFFAEHLR